MPTYHCENKCVYCYLGDMREHEDLLDLNVLQTRLIELSTEYIINAAEIYGGDINLLEESYLKELFKTARRFTKSIYCTAYPSEKLLKLINPRYINVSVNKHRKDYRENLKAAKELGCNVITVAIPPETLTPSEELLVSYEGLKGYVSFMPYSESVANRENGYMKNNKIWDGFMLDIVKEYMSKKYSFKLSNLEIMKDALNGYYDPLMEHNIFITPSGSFANVEFIGKKEYFKERTLASWQGRVKMDRDEYVYACAHCEFYMKGCTADHVPVIQACNGTRETMKWLKQHLTLQK